MAKSGALQPSREALAAAQAGARAFLRKHASEQRKKAVPVNTKRAYDTDFRQFEAWCAALGYPPLPTTPEALCSFLLHLSQDRRTRTRKKGPRRGEDIEDFAFQPGSIERKLTAIVKRHKEKLLPSPRTDTVSEQMRAIWRERETRPRPAAPLLGPQLLAIADAMDRESNPDLRALVLRDRAALLIGWHCAMRRSEIAALNLSSLEFFADGMTVHIGRSKTDQQGKGRTLWIKASARHLSACPIAAARSWIDYRGDSDGALLWRTGQRETRHTLTSGERMPPWQMVGIIDRWTKRAGCTPESVGSEFTPHSLRSGFITHAMRKRLPTKETMEHSGHKSLETFMGYVRVATGFDSTVQDGILDD